MEYCASDLKAYLHDNKTNRDKRLLSEEEAQGFMRQIGIFFEKYIYFLKNYLIYCF